MRENRLRISVLFLASGIVPFLLYSYVLKLRSCATPISGVAGAAGETYSATETHRVDNPSTRPCFVPSRRPCPGGRARMRGSCSSGPWSPCRPDRLPALGKKSVAFHFTNLFFHCLALRLSVSGGPPAAPKRLGRVSGRVRVLQPPVQRPGGLLGAERASVMSLALGLAGLYCHIRFRAEEKRAWELGAWLLFILAFLAGERVPVPDRLLPLRRLPLEKGTGGPVAGGCSGWGSPTRCSVFPWVFSSCISRRPGTVSRVTIPSWTKGSRPGGSRLHFQELSALCAVHAFFVP